MANLFQDSFDHYSTATAAKKGWTYAGAAASAGAEGVSIGAFGRNSTNGMRCVHGNFAAAVATLSLASSGTTVIIGIAVNLGSVARGSDMSLFSLRRASTGQVSVAVTTGGALVVKRGDWNGTTLGTSSVSLSASTWYFVELKVLFSDTVGTWDLKIDGTSRTSGTGADTNNGGTAGPIDSITFGHSSVTNTPDPEFSYDDLYVFDGAGGVDDDFAGDHRQVWCPAGTGNGTNDDWSKSSGSDAGALVDENPPNESDYVQSGTSGQRTTFNIAAIGVTGTVRSVQHVNYLKAQAAGIRSVGEVVRIGSTNYDSAGAAIGSDWTYKLARQRVSPATGVAWTTSEIDGAEWGAKVTV